MDVKRVSIQNDSPLFTRYVYLCTLHIEQTLGVTCQFLTAALLLLLLLLLLLTRQVFSNMTG